MEERLNNFKVNHHAPGSERTTTHESPAGALGIPESMPPIGGGTFKVNHHAPGSERTTTHESQAGAFGIPESMPPDWRQTFKVNRITPEIPPSKALSEYPSLQERWAHAEKVLVGIGKEWRIDSGAQGEGEPEERDRENKLTEAYEALHRLLKDKDYFIVTTNTDAAIFRSSLDKSRITAPCGNVTWRQCSEACTKDIWEPGEIPDNICPHCGAPLTGNTIDAETYIEEGYLPQWRAYTGWLAAAMNRGVLLLELGEGFKVPTVIRWPFEKTVRYNQKSFLYRVNETFAQVAEGTGERSVSVKENSVKWIQSQDF